MAVWRAKGWGSRRVCAQLRSRGWTWGGGGGGGGGRAAMHSHPLGPSELGSVSDPSRITARSRIVVRETVRSPNSLQSWPDTVQAHGFLCHFGAILNNGELLKNDQGMLK